MGVISTALSSVVAQQVQTQGALAAVFAKQQRQQDASLIALLQDGAKNIESINSTPPPGLGKVIDVTA